MVGLPMVGTLTHEIETLCEALAKNAVPLTKEVFDLICIAQDQIALMIETLRNNETPNEAIEVIQKIHAYLHQTEHTGSDIPSVHKNSEKAPVQVHQQEELKSETTTKPVEVMRVRTEIVERLNGLSTENSMLRVGLEQQLLMFNTGLLNVKRSIKRFATQLNHLNSEIEQLPPMPLEQERRQPNVKFLLEQLSHSLKETQTDLEQSLRVLADTNARMENQVLQQTKISTELQQRLTNIRLTPFVSIVPRLSRIARQISTELNKKIEFKITKSEGEMDRTVLEQLVPSMEHILRNAIDHGIEDTEKRLASNKPEIGTIEVSFVRVGSNVSIEIKDDGGGIPPNVIRAKAIKLGLLKPDISVSDEEVIRYIMEPGFSTREVVTEISGRGLGMDVVNTAVNEMGGNLTIQSEVGVGTKMIIRFPFTISLNRVLIFNIQEQLIGILLANIESVSNVPAQILQESSVTIGEKTYELFYLGALLNTEQKKFRIPKKGLLPVLLFNDLEYPVAIVIDNILYSRDLVVQALGPQFKLSNEYVGATTLGDGRVVFILDTYRLSMQAKAVRESVRMMADVTTQPEENVYTDMQSLKFLESELVLVVDDSISARTMTKLLLERNQFRVIMATDGMDALEKMEREIPDLIISDIDMPRMDGLEFVFSLQQNAAYKDIPIIMVTSRTGEHVKRANELGITHLLAKPYDENVLLSLMNKLLEKKI
jgi:chemosensory pili system protein ChpA (sensor histidine kinase/response regulator)